ncbi:MAG: Ig-like domain-containing protein, partial [Thermoguttaceae bacterium]
MATRFVRIDLADEARDYRLIAVEPGVPMLDRSGANGRIVYRWLGGMVAEPVWEGDCVNFYVRDDQGGRLEEALCQPATEQDLQTLLKDDVEKLRSRLEAATPETPTERLLKRVLLRTFQDLLDNPNRSNLDSYFFRYRDVTETWRLVWCWGYQRVDQEPAPSVICNDPKCNQLFVRRPGKSPKCPGCSQLFSLRPLRRTNLNRSILIGLLLLLLVSALVWWFGRPSRLIATPASFSGPPGARIEYAIKQASLFQSKNVSGQAVGIPLDPGVVRYNQITGAARIVGPIGSETTIHFQMGNLKTDVKVKVTAAANPERITIEPHAIELGVGTTAQLKLIGEYADGTKADLTEAALWKAEDGPVVYANKGFVEGKSPGTATISVRFRGSPESPYIEQTANVSVEKIDFQSLEAAVEPLPVGLGRASKLRMEAVAADARRYSVLGSSLLKTDVSPYYLATVVGQNLRGERIGSGKLLATFMGEKPLAAEKPFSVAGLPGVDQLVVTPESLSMAVGEIADLAVASPSMEPVHFSSSKPEVVEISAANRLIGRSEGAAQVEVAQGGRKQTVDVTVAKAEFQSIALDPAEVVVPVDDQTQPRVVARIKGDETARSVEIAPDLLAVDKAPSPRYVDFFAKLLAMRGVTPTTPSTTQTLAVHFDKHKTSAPVEVVLAPLQLELTPAGPIDLPLGQQMRLQCWANYSEGRRVQLPGERLKWSADSKGAAPGLELRGDRVAALKPSGGPLPVYAAYFRHDSNQVIFKSIDADPNLKLAVEVDRTLRLAGEKGKAVITASGPGGDVELVPEMSSFKSGDAKILAIEEKSGNFTCGVPGGVTVTGSHAAAKEPATLNLHVYDPAGARLAFEPASVRVAVNEQAPLRLFLEAKDGEKTDRAQLEGPGVGYAIGQPQAVGWNPPLLTGLKPAKPFEISASYYPVLSGTATAKVEVAAAADEATLRIVPSEVSLAPGQTRSFAVEQQTADGGDTWKEVRPESVAWIVPSGAIWEPAAGSLRPALTVPAGAKGKFELHASFAGQKEPAVALVTVKDKAPALDADAHLSVDREPEGRYLQVGQQQRYTIMVGQDEAKEAAPEVRWPANFENQYVKWQAPVLTAKQEGYDQWIRADVAGRTVLFRTTTYKPGEFETPPMSGGERPVAVKILSDQGNSVRFAVGAEFDDFRVVAVYSDGFTRVVTKNATIRMPEPPQNACLSVANGLLVGVRPGQTMLSAEFDGVKSTAPLGAEVTAEVEADEIVLKPAPVKILTGETYPMRVMASKAKKSVGNIAKLANVTWQSDRPVVRIDGHSVVGVSLGDANVTAKFAALTSPPTLVSVVHDIADRLKIVPAPIVLRIGESVPVGYGVQIFRGELDMSHQCIVAVAPAGVAEYHADSRTIVGIHPSNPLVPTYAIFTLGDKVSKTEVRVSGLGGPITGEVVVEPASTQLAPGQAEPLQIYVSNAHINRTGSAVLTSSNPGVVKILGNRVCAVAPGTTAITASVAGTGQTGLASVTVNDEQVASVSVDPKNLDLSVGDVGRFRILGHAPKSGTHEMYAQDDLKLGIKAPNPGFLRILGPDSVNAQAAGQGSVTINWRSAPEEQMLVNVTNNPFTDLKIEPPLARVDPGQAVVYTVTGMKNGTRRNLTPDNGVQLFTDNRAVAQVIDGLTVMADGPGRTTVTAKLAGQQAEAILEVTGNGRPGGIRAIDTQPVVIDDGGILGTGREERTYDPGVIFTNVGPTGGLIVSQSGETTYGGSNAAVTGLRFSPDTLRLGANSPDQVAHVIEVLANGQDGRDVTNDPDLRVTVPEP